MSDPGLATGRNRDTCWLVVTDLDGTLLDDHYDLTAAARALDRQAWGGRSVALASSKTLDEMLELARLCEVAPVLIFENGAGIAWPDPHAGADPARYQLETVGESYGSLRSRLRGLRRRRGFRFVGFGDLSASEVARLTGLSRDGARLARHRQCSEPLLWLDVAERLEEFREAVDHAGYRVVAGGRFHHVMPRTDKACGLRRVASRLVSRTRRRVRVIACGDADNDLAMLKAADHAVVFPRRDGSYLEVQDRSNADRAIRVAEPGPAAWSRAVDRVVRNDVGGRADRGKADFEGRNCYAEARS